jgi:hypothetical protein
MHLYGEDNLRLTKKEERFDCKMRKKEDMRHGKAASRVREEKTGR